MQLDHKKKHIPIDLQGLLFAGVAMFNQADGVEISRKSYLLYDFSSECLKLS